MQKLSIVFLHPSNLNPKLYFERAAVIKQAIFEVFAFSFTKSCPLGRLRTTPPTDLHLIMDQNLSFMCTADVFGSPASSASPGG